MTPADLPGEVLFLLDVSGWIHAGFRGDDGRPGADHVLPYCVGKLVKLLRDHRPTFLAAALDPEPGERTWRHQLYPRYQESRIDKGPAFHAQKDLVLQVLGLHAIPLLGAYGYDADDVLAAACHLGRVGGVSAVVVITEDKDLRQLVTAGDQLGPVYTWAGPAPDDANPLQDPEVVQERHGVPPHLLGDWLALVGDKADDVPGVDGVGAKLAAEVLTRWGCLDAVLDEARAVALSFVDFDGTKAKASKRSKKSEQERDDEARWKLCGERAKERGFPGAAVVSALASRTEEARLSRRLVALRDDAPIPFDLERCRVDPRRWRRSAIDRIYQEHGFSRLADSLRAGGAT